MGPVGADLRAARVRSKNPLITIKRRAWHTLSKRNLFFKITLVINREP